MKTAPAHTALPFDETVSYWKSGTSSPDKWLSDSAALIAKRGGQLLISAFGVDPTIQREAYCLRFRFKEDLFSLTWPVLPTRLGRPDEQQAARRQAATMLFHDVKAKLLAAEVLGMRRAFFSHLLLGDGRTVVDHAQDVAALPQILEATPRLTAPESQP